MGKGYERCIRPLLFTQDSEAAHNRTMAILARMSPHAPLRRTMRVLYGAPPLPVRVMGLSFPNPVGLAAGMDKHAAAVPLWECLGFGFCELGGVTWHAQPGNPAPRMFRIPADEALINRMGFNNPGAAALAQRLQQWRAQGAWPQHPVGINLGKSKITPLEEAAEDYARSFQLLRHAADFFVVNVSSPNTQNLRQLQDRAALETILRRLQNLNCADASPPGEANLPVSPTPSGKPILVKVAPDLTEHALTEILEVAQTCRLAGIVASNTTLARPESPADATRAAYAETGGLSGRPLRARSTAVIRHLYRESRGQIPIVGVGGIFTAEDAWEKIAAGASLVQIYTGLVYRGPSLVRELVVGLKQKLAERGFTSLLAAVGTEG